MAENAPKTWLITGCSSGFGQNLAQAALARGDNVAATARRPETLSGLCNGYPETAMALELDVTRPETVRSAIDAAVERFGRIDVVVNNAGYGLQSAVEEATEAQIRDMFEVNVFGPLNVIRAVLPQLRGQGSGHIVNVSSVGGRSAAPLISLYSSTKFAIEGLSAGLAMELEPFGIKVTVIEPGAFDTGFAGAVRLPDTVLEPYREVHEATHALLAGMEFADPAGCVEAILTAVDAEDPPRQLIAGGHAYDIVEQVMAGQLEEMRRWKPVSKAADAD